MRLEPGLYSRGARPSSHFKLGDAPAARIRAAPSILPPATHRCNGDALKRERGRAEGRAEEASKRGEAVADAERRGRAEAASLSAMEAATRAAERGRSSSASRRKCFFWTATTWRRAPWASKKGRSSSRPRSRGPGWR